MSITLAVSWLLPISAIAYLVLLARMVQVLQAEHPDYWQSVGNPSKANPNGQIIILKMILWPGVLPKEISDLHALNLRLVRLFAALSLLLFFSVLLLISGGYLART